MLEERTFTSLAEAARELAKQLAGAMNEGVRERSQASLAVSGGRTPQSVFEHLCLLPVDWKNVTLTLTDERWVAPGHAESNERLVRTYLLQNAARMAAFIPLYGGETRPADGQPACEKRLEKIRLPFDAVYLGMGEDGHFASLFPNDAAVIKEQSLCVAVPQTESRLPRMSLTAKTILDARMIFLLFSGEKKYEMYEKAKLKGPVSEIPIRLILQQTKVPIKVLYAP